MARIVGAVTTSHVPAIGGAIAYFIFGSARRVDG